MTRYSLYLIAALLILILPQCQNKDKEHPNIVFFLVDDLGWTDLGCYGSSFYETPNVDRLAEEGVRFTTAYAACHVCSPTRASILTGKYPATLNLTDWLPGRKDFDFQRLKNVEINQQLPLEEITLAERLKQEGYTTAIFGKWHLGEDPSGPLQHGFDVQVPDWNKGWPLSYYAPFKLPGFDGEEGEYLTDRLTEEALSFIEVNREKPFFLYLSHFAVHDPIEGRGDLVEKYKDKLETQSYPEAPEYILEGNPDEQNGISKKALNKLAGSAEFEGYSQLPHNSVKIKQRQDNVQFAGMVESMDESLGRIMTKLEELDIADNTIVVFFSDNGGMAAANFGNPKRVLDPSKLDKAFSTSNLPLRGAKGWLYEGGIRVPMIVKWPQAGESGVTCQEPVISTDFYPSLLEMLGLDDGNQNLDGHSLVPLIKGEAMDRGAIYWHFPHYSNHGMQSPGGAIRDGDYKLIEYYENGSVQLFDLKNDLAEEHDLSEAEPDKVLELREKLRDWRERVGAKMMAPNPQYLPQEKLRDA